MTEAALRSDGVALVRYMSEELSEEHNVVYRYVVTDVYRCLKADMENWKSRFPMRHVPRLIHTKNPLLRENILKVQT